MDTPELTDEEYRQLLSLGGQNVELMNAIQAQKAQADRLRSAAPDMRGNGRIQTAPSVLEYLGNFAKNNVAGSLDKQVTQQQGTMNQNSQMQNQMVLQQILRGQRQPTQAPMAAPAQPSVNPYAAMMRGGNT